jgi:hypothetical protein
MNELRIENSELRITGRDKKSRRSAVPKGHNFHNRRSATCGIGTHHTLCPKGRTDRLSKSCLSGSFPDVPFRRSMTCGYENHVPSGLFVAAQDNDAQLMDCFASLANASSTESMTDAVKAGFSKSDVSDFVFTSDFRNPTRRILCLRHIFEIRRVGLQHRLRLIFNFQLDKSDLLKHIKD